MSIASRFLWDRPEAVLGNPSRTRRIRTQKRDPQLYAIQRADKSLQNIGPAGDYAAHGEFRVRPERSSITLSLGSGWRKRAETPTSAAHRGGPWRLLGDGGAKAFCMVMASYAHSSAVPSPEVAPQMKCRRRPLAKALSEYRVAGARRICFHLPAAGSRYEPLRICRSG